MASQRRADFCSPPSVVDIVDNGYEFFHDGNVLGLCLGCWWDNNLEFVKEFCGYGDDLVLLGHGWDGRVGRIECLRSCDAEMMGCLDPILFVLIVFHSWADIERVGCMRRKHPRLPGSSYKMASVAIGEMGILL